jgi:hypothetical protein
MKSQILAHDDITGVFDSPISFDFNELTLISSGQKKKSETDKYNGYKGDLIRYYNFYMIN